ncbi:hypothetical protein PS2_045248 [Malus domestica]
MSCDYLDDPPRELKRGPISRRSQEAFTFSNLSHSDAKEFPLSSSLNGLTGLQQLELQANLLSGEFPELGSLHNLSYLDVINNAISGVGNIPKNIKKLGFLQQLTLSFNQFTSVKPPVSPSPGA